MVDLTDKLLVTYEHEGQWKTFWILDQWRHAEQLPWDTSKFRSAVVGLLGDGYLACLLDEEWALSKEKTRGRITTETTPYDDIMNILKESRTLLAALREQIDPQKTQHGELARVFRAYVQREVNALVKKFWPYHQEMQEYTIQED